MTCGGTVQLRLSRRGCACCTLPGPPPAIRAIFKQDTQVDYYDGEDTGEKG